MAHTFKVGDIIVPKASADDAYNVTNRDMQMGKVIDVFPYSIRIVVLKHRNSHEIGYQFDVSAEHFDHIQRAQAIIKDVIYNPPATVVFWSDGTKTVAKCAPHEQYDREKGLAICCAKKLLGAGYAEAFKEFREPENRVLTMDEVHALENGTKVYVEKTRDAYGGEGVYVKTESRLMSQGGRNWAIDKVAEKEFPMSRWARVWLLPRKPTAAELAANPWKLEGN